MKILKPAAVVFGFLTCGLLLMCPPRKTVEFDEIKIIHISWDHAASYQRSGRTCELDTGLFATEILLAAAFWGGIFILVKEMRWQPNIHQQSVIVAGAILFILMLWYPPWWIGENPFYYHSSVVLRPVVKPPVDQKAISFSYAPWADYAWGKDHFNYLGLATPVLLAQCVIFVLWLVGLVRWLTTALTWPQLVVLVGYYAAVFVLAAYIILFSFLLILSPLCLACSVAILAYYLWKHADTRSLKLEDAPIERD